MTAKTKKNLYEKSVTFHFYLVYRQLDTHECLQLRDFL